jgi:hypothetical protein
METTIIEDSSPQAKKFAAHARKLAVVKSYPPALFSPVAKNPYTHHVYPKLFRREQDIQNTHLKDWIRMANKQLITSKFNPISQDANFDRKVRIFKSWLQCPRASSKEYRLERKVQTENVVENLNHIR